MWAQIDYRLTFFPFFQTTLPMETIAVLNADAIRKGIRSSLMTETFKAIPDLAKTADMDRNDLLRLYLGSEYDAFYKTPDALADKAIIGISDRIGWSADISTRRAVIVENRPNRSRPIGSCYSNALLEHRATGNEVFVGYEMSCIGICAHLTPHAFNYDRKTDTFYDTDHPRHSKTLPDRLCLMMLSFKDSLVWLKSKYKYENFALTRGCFWLCALTDKVVILQYSVKDITKPTEVRTLIRAEVVTV